MLSVVDIGFVGANREWLVFYNFHFAGEPVLLLLPHDCCSCVPSCYRSSPFLSRKGLHICLAVSSCRAESMCMLIIFIAVNLDL